MYDLSILNHPLTEQCVDFFAGSQMVYHCHHFNLFLDQTVDDALGEELGAKVRFFAARASAREVLKSTFAHLDIVTPAERFELARTLFATIGHGTLDFDAGPEGGTAKGSFLHYGFSWKEKYGGEVRRFHPADSFAAGWASAALELAYDLPPLTMCAREKECIVSHAAHCVFFLEPGETDTPRPRIDRAIVKAVFGPPITGLLEERITVINEGLRDFLSGVSGDERGLVQAFGVFVARHLTDYYNRLSYETYFGLKARSAGLANVGRQLFIESGHVCVFNTFAGILYSPEWDALVGRINGELEEVVSSCFAIARALGFGRWAIGELTPNRLVLRTSSDYESPYVHTHYGPTDEPLTFFIEGAAVGIMQIWDVIDWKERPPLDKRLYRSLFQSGATHWNFKQTKSLLGGAAFNEFVVTRNE